MRWISPHSVFGKTALCLIICLPFITVLSGSGIVSAQGGTTVDWRGNLTCPSEHQVREGILYCTGTDSTGHKVHVLVADLSVSSLRFEYVLPEGESDGHSGVRECRDPNVPAWGGPAKGCFEPGNPSLYPRMTLTMAVERAKEVRSSPPVVAVVNADYGASDGTHGPEGLMVVRGQRLDGAANCDDDFNAALRPWLGLGETVDRSTGLITATIARLDTDSSPLPISIYTGVGGGPWLVREGTIYNGAANCQGDRTLHELEPVENCTGNLKFARPPKTEGYGAGSCRAAPHMAAGLSQDGRWLFLAMSTGADHPDVLARFMHDQLGTWNALKFDGGGSSQLWFDGATPLTIDAGGVNRPLSNFLAVYAERGDGIQLPLGAEPVERIYYKVLTSGETAEFTLEVKNTGDYSWFPEDGIELRVEPFFTLSPVAETLPLSDRVAPGEVATWQWQAGTGGLNSCRFRMVQRGKPFGSDFAVVVVTLPEELEEKRKEIEQAIQDTIQEWRDRGEQELDRLMEELRARIERELKGFLERLVADLLRELREALRGVCGGAVIVVPAAVLVWRRRRLRL